MCLTSCKKEVRGIDVSHYNHLTTKDWRDLVTKQNVKFVYIKVSEGETYKDSKRYTHYKNAKNNNLLVGTYHFFRDDIPAEKQYYNYEHATSEILWDLIPCIDYEKAGFKKDFKSRIKVLRELNDLFINRSGIYPIIYCDLIQYIQIRCFLPNNQFWISASSPNLGLGTIKQYDGKINNKIIDYNKCNTKNILFFD